MAELTKASFEALTARVEALEADSVFEISSLRLHRVCAVPPPADVPPSGPPPELPQPPPTLPPQSDVEPMIPILIPPPRPAGPVVEAGDHTYFDNLVLLPEKIRSYSLRTQAQLNSLVTGSPSDFYRYTWPVDDYARPQDAAKLVKPARKDTNTYFPTRGFGNVGDESVINNQRLRFPLGYVSDKVLITWDFYWGEEFQTNAGWEDNPVNGWKTFYLYAGTGTGGTETQWLGHDNTGNARFTPGAVSEHHEGMGSKLVTRATGMIKRDPLEPTGPGAQLSRGFNTYYNRWTRYWLEYRQWVPGSEFTEWSNAYLGGVPLAGTWDMASLWIADEQRDPVRIFYRVPAGRRAVDTMLANFRISLDTSTNNFNGGGAVGPFIAYVRNVVVLKNYALTESDPLIFQRPVTT